jgi:uncharacterized protein (DUF697 family)
MAVISREALAGIRLMICMAKADGVLRSEERYQLEDALAGVDLPEKLTIATLLDEQNDAEKLAAEITTAEARDSVYASVFAMAYADREMAPSEAKIISMLRKAWTIHQDEEKDLARALDAVHEATEHIGASAQQQLPEKEREARFQRVLLRYALLTGLTGAIPVPLVPSLLIVPLQVKMVYDIAGLHGQRADKHTVQLMFETLGVGTGCQIAIFELAKLVPGIGSVIGATGSFASTFALGKVCDVYYKSEGKTTIESLKPMYREERQKGKAEFQKHKEALAEAHEHHEDEIRQLAFELQQGKISTKEYEERMDKL